MSKHLFIVNINVSFHKFETLGGISLMFPSFCALNVDCQTVVSGRDEEVWSAVKNDRKRDTVSAPKRTQALALLEKLKMLVRYNISQGYLRPSRAYKISSFPIAHLITDRNS